MRILFFILVFTSLFNYSQKVEILEPSGFKHDYVVSTLNYLEDFKDTSRLKYICVLRMSGVYNHELSIIDWHDILKIRAKELGANSYYVLSYTEAETSAILIVKLFFAGENLIKTNKLKRKRNTALIFSQNKFVKDSAHFYIDGKKVNFYPDKYYDLPIVLKQKYIISINKLAITSKKIQFKKNKQSRFFVLPRLKTNVVFVTPLVLGLAGGVALAISANSFHELKYETGRFLMEIYK